MNMTDCSVFVMVLMFIDVGFESSKTLIKAI